MAAKKNSDELTGQEVEQTEATEQTEAAEDTEATEQEQPQQEQQDAAAEEFSDIPNPCVYCGPSAKGVARQYTTYQGGIPKELQAFLRAHPAARKLIVSTSQFAGMRKRLETHGTAEEIVYKKVKSEL